MCKCNKNEENNMGMELLMNLVDLIFGVDEEAKKSESNINLDKEIDHVVFNNPATIVFWKDGTKTVTKCHSEDTFNKETGLAMCIIRKLTGNKHYNTVFEKYCK